MKKLLFIPLLVVCCARDHEKTPDITGNNPVATSLSGNPLYPRSLSPEVLEKRTKQWQEARKNYLADPGNADYIIWYGRRCAYLQRYREAVEIFTEGIKKHPQSARLYRHRGHRYITLREFDKALQDFEKAALLMAGEELEIEPDGLPNQFNIPLSNTQFNIYYHWGLVYYLKRDYQNAAKTYRECLKYCNNDDLLAATLDWLYMTLRRDHRDTEAWDLLERIDENMKIIENQSYFRRLMMYKGLENPQALLQINGEDPQQASLVMATQGYGVANWYYYNGAPQQAHALLLEVIDTDEWSAFGYIAAESDLYHWDP